MQLTDIDTRASFKRSAQHRKRAGWIKFTVRRTHPYNPGLVAKISLRLAQAGAIYVTGRMGHDITSETSVCAPVSSLNITRATAKKWLKRDDVQDRSHRAHTLHTTLSAAQEAIVLALRQSLYLPLDDLLFITRQYITADVSRSGIARLLKREGMSRLEDVTPKAEGETIAPKKTFKDYKPGFFHIDIKYLPQMPDETSRRYLFVAIDRATRWVFMHVYGNMTEASSIDFLRRLKLASPIKINKILTANGSQFTDRFTTKDKKPSGKHAFDVACAAIPAEHRLAPPPHPQTNGMVERFNGRINELLQQTRLDSRADLETTLLNYLKLYNHHIPQRAIDSKTPILALKEWQKNRPGLFVKCVYDQTGLDTYL